MSRARPHQVYTVRDTLLPAIYHPMPRYLPPQVYTVRDTLLKQPRFKNHFVVSFEPLLDKYASNLAARSKAVMRAALGHHHRRGVILPFAVGPNEGVMDLQASP